MSQPRYESTCDMACDRAYECDSSVDVEGCSAECRGDAADIGPNLSQQFLGGIEACVQELSCPELAVASILMSCQREAAARIAPSAAAESLCGAVVDSLQECSGIGVGTAGCLQSVKIFSDSALRSAEGCENLPCDQRLPCLQDELGLDPTETQ